jgi:hypothetical protein
MFVNTSLNKYNFWWQYFSQHDLSFLFPSLYPYLTLTITPYRLAKVISIKQYNQKLNDISAWIS